MEVDYLLKISPSRLPQVLYVNHHPANASSYQGIADKPNSHCISPYIWETVNLNDFQEPFCSFLLDDLLAVQNSWEPLHGSCMLFCSDVMLKIWYFYYSSSSARADGKVQYVIRYQNWQLTAVLVLAISRVRSPPLQWSN